MAALCLELVLQHVVLAGGFAASDWLFNKVHEKLLPHGLNTIRPENYVFVRVPWSWYRINFPFRNKAVSDGALSFYHDHFVRTHVSKITYGNFCHIPFDPAVPDHQSRLHKTFTSISGLRRIKDSFEVILPKVCLFHSWSRFWPIRLCRTLRCRRQWSLESHISENPTRCTSSR